MNWRPVRLGHLVQCLDSQRVPLNREERSVRPGPIPYWGAGGVVDHINEQMFDEPLVLLGEDGAPFFDAAKPVAFHVTGPIWVNNHIHVLRPGAEVDGRFLAHALNAVDFGQYITGSTRDKLTQDDMRAIRLLMPDLNQQRRIADVLDRQISLLDRSISLRQQQVELLAERERAHVDSLLARLMLDMPLIPVKYLVVERDDRDGGSVAPPPLMSVSIHRGVVPRSEMTDSEPRADDLANYKVCRAGDVVLNRMRAFQGGVGVAPVDGLVSPDYAVLRPVEGVRPEWLSVLFRSSWFVSEMTRRLRGLGGVDQGAVRTPRINVADLGLIRVPVLDVRQQDEVVRELHADRSWRAALARLGVEQARLLTERKVALIGAAVTGELPVSQVRSVA